MASHSRRRYNKSCQSISKNYCDNCVNVDCNELQKPCCDNSSDNSYCCAKCKKSGSPTSSETFVWGCSGVKPMAKFYDSIPDYCDIYHLPKNQFDTTLKSLRVTCQKLRSTEMSPTESALECGSIDDKSTSSISSLLPQPPKEKKAKKSSRKKLRKLKVKHQASPCNSQNQDYLFDKNRFQSFKEDCEKEVEAFRKSLKEFEKELKRPITSPCHLEKVHSPSQINEGTQTNETKPTFLEEELNHKKKFTEKVDSKSTFNLSESLKKSLSLNDIHEDPCDNIEKAEKNRLLARLGRLNDLDLGETTKSSYFLNSKHEISKDDQQEKLSKSYDFSRQFNKKYRTSKKKKRAKSEENFKMPFSPLSHSDNRLAGIQAFPVHPVSRPNLAAKLRVEVCKQKLREQKTKCTFYDGTKHFDWEVRKTPAWKSLSMQETHDQTIMLRLAARKAEQALQQRQYEMNLELMRQRVKSAPLLLEGETNFGINVGKLTHNCHQLGSQQTCHSNRSSRQRGRKKNSYSLTLCPHHKTELCMSQEMFKRTEAESRLSNKIQTIKTIYANNSKLLGSEHPQKNGTSCLKKHKSYQKSKAQKSQHQQNFTQNESGDELSSVDRAYL